MPTVDKNLYIDHINKNYVTPIDQNIAINIASSKNTIIPLENQPPFNEYFLNPPGYHGDKDITITYPDGHVEIMSTDGGTLIPTASGIYTIRYRGAIRHTTGAGAIQDSPYTIAFSITAVPNYEPKPRWNIRTVLERILNSYKPHLQDDPNPFKLDPTQAAEFEKIESPELAITNKTLKEALDIVGGYIHGIPRLVRGADGELNTIKFDMLGSTERAALNDPRWGYITQIYSQGIEDYVTELDSSVENLVNSIEPAEGSVTEPYYGGFTTTRSEELYAQITEGNMVIATSQPIYSVQKLEVVDTKGKVADITGYVFEGAEYGRLSSFEGEYPMSKAFAIYYTLGQKNIKGLNFKSPNVIGGAGSNYAITNIIKAVTGDDISASVWDEGKYAQLKFRITYTPIFSTRMTMHKTYYEVGMPQSSLYYNQADNLAETRYYGENLKGVAARMGNPERLITYLVGTFTLIPRAGQMWDDEYYVSGVTNALYFDHFECSISLSRDFNRLSQYIGINSEWRAYEVSEKTAYKRDMVYSDYAVIGEIKGDNNALNKEYGVLLAFLGNAVRSIPISAATVRSYDKDGNNFATCTLPVISSSFGNVLSFRFVMADNYSAGPQSVLSEKDNVSGYWQTDVPYVDYYGEVDTVTFELSRSGITNDNAPFELPRGAYASSGSVEIRVPEYDRLEVDKNGGEVLGFNYEIQFVTTLKDVVIGPAITRRSPLVGAINTTNAELYVLQAPITYSPMDEMPIAGLPIGKFDKTIDLTKAKKQIWFVDRAKAENRRITFNNCLANTDGAAWVIAAPDTGEIYFGRNIAVKKNTYIEIPPIIFTHKLP